jgi:hypothetical protein
VKTWTRYEFVSADGTVRAHGRSVRDQRTGSGATHSFYNYHLIFVKQGVGVVARYRVLTHYVYDANGRLVSVKIV